MDLLLFSADTKLIRACGDQLDGVVIDWERHDKVARQLGADTQITTDTYSDLPLVRSQYDGPLLVRLDGTAARLESELELAVHGGADEILVPMVNSPAAVERVLEAANGRPDVSVMIETPDAVAKAEEFAKLPIRRAFVGLNDLAIARQSSSIFDAVLDGTIGSVRQRFNRPLGFGGLTDPNSGWPIPARLLLNELVAAGCDFTFLRRSFIRD